MATTKSSPGMQSFSKHCVLVPKNNESRVSIQSAHGIDVRFHSVVQLEDPSAASFDSTLSPLIERTKAGENTTVIFGGTRCANVVSKMVSQSASVLLQANTDDIKSCRVTFSWFNIDCEASELLVDVLKAAAAITNPAAGNIKSTELFLREAGHGKGAVVPGLLEIEIAKDGDLQALLTHLEATVPNIATFTCPGVHTVCQLTFSDLTKKKPSFRKDFVAMGSITDMLDVGRITFIQLSDVVSSGPPSTHQATTAAPLSPKRPKVGRSKTEPEDVVTKGGYYPWVEHTKTVVQWLESKRASTPFHKSRLLLLLKDVLLRRQKAALLLMLQPSVDQHQANLDWLRLVSLLSRTGPSAGSAGPSVGPAASTAVSTSSPAAATPVVTTTAHPNIAHHSTTTTRRVSVTAPSPDTHHHHSSSPAMPIHKKIARRRSSTAGESSPPARRASVKTFKHSPQAASPQMDEQAGPDGTTHGASPTNAGADGATNGTTATVPHERRGSRLFRSTAKLLDLPEGTLQAAAASVPVPAEGQLQKAGSGFTLTKKKSLQKVTSLTPKEISVAMRELSLRNKKAAKIAEMEKTAEELPAFSVDANKADGAAEIAELMKRLAAMEEKCRSLEVENVQLIMAAQQQQPNNPPTAEGSAASAEKILSLEEQLRVALERITALEQLCSAEVELNAALVARHEEEVTRLRSSLAASAAESKSVTPANEASEVEPHVAAAVAVPETSAPATAEA